MCPIGMKATYLINGAWSGAALSMSDLGSTTRKETL